MTIEELVPLTNGLSVSTNGCTLVCDRARVLPVKGDGVDLKFWVVGTDIVPRLRLTSERIAKVTAEDLIRLVRHVVRRAAGRD